MTARPCIPARRPTYAAGSKIGLNNTIKIGFICYGECSIEWTIRAFVVTLCSRQVWRSAGAMPPTHTGNSFQFAEDGGSPRTCVFLAVGRKIMLRADNE